MSASAPAASAALDPTPSVEIDLDQATDLILQCLSDLPTAKLGELVAAAGEIISDRVTRWQEGATALPEPVDEESSPSELPLERAIASTTSGELSSTGVETGEDLDEPEAQPEAIEKAPLAADAAKGNPSYPTLRDVPVAELEQLPDEWEILVGDRSFSYMPEPVGRTAAGKVSAVAWQPWDGTLLNNNGGLDFTDGGLQLTSAELIELYGALPFTLGAPGRLSGGKPFLLAELPAWMQRILELNPLEGQQSTATFGELLDTMDVPKDVQQAMADAGEILGDAICFGLEEQAVDGLKASTAALGDEEAAHGEIVMVNPPFTEQPGQGEGEQLLSKLSEDQLEAFRKVENLELVFPTVGWGYDKMWSGWRGHRFDPATGKGVDGQAQLGSDLLLRLHGQDPFYVRIDNLKSIDFLKFKLPPNVRELMSVKSLQDYEAAEAKWRKANAGAVADAARLKTLAKLKEVQRGSYYGHLSVEHLDSLLNDPEMGKPDPYAYPKKDPVPLAGKYISWTIHAGDTSWHGCERTVNKEKVRVWEKNGGTDKLTSAEFIEQHRTTVIRVESQSALKLTPPKWASKLTVTHAAQIKDAKLPLPGEKKDTAAPAAQGAASGTA